MTTNRIYLDLIQKVITHGVEVCPRGIWTREIITNVVTFDMNHPIITIPERKLSYRFMIAEAHWILSGSRLLHHHPVITDKLRRYSDDNHTLSGAYGPSLLEQIRYVYSLLSEEPHTRQAVISFWKPSPIPSKDIPCTVSLQFLLRRNKIHTVANMRSSDVFLGIPYDLFSFTMITLFLMTFISDDLDLGTLTIFAGSQHIYEEDVERTTPLCDNGENLSIDRHRFINPDDLMKQLGAIMDDPNDNVLSLIKEKICLA